MRTAAVAILACLALGCQSKKPPEQPRQPLTQRQRDSAIGASRLPGAKGVQKAMGAADSAAARRAREDSISAGR